MQQFEDPENFLAGEFGVVWGDDRDGNREIYFTRIDGAGNKIGGDTRLTNDTGNSDIPSLVWNGAGYAVAWNDDRRSDRLWQYCNRGQSHQARRRRIPDQAR